MTIELVSTSVVVVVLYKFVECTTNIVVAKIKAHSNGKASSIAAAATPTCPSHPRLMEEVVGARKDITNTRLEMTDLKNIVTRYTDELFNRMREMESTGGRFDERLKTIKERVDRLED